MPLLQAIYDSQDEIPAEYQSLYAERDGKWEIAEVEGVKTQTDIDKLKQAAIKERELHAETKRKLAPWNALKMTPEEVHEHLDRIPELEAGVGDGKLDDEKVNNLVQARLKKEMGPINRTLEENKNTIQELRDQNALLLSEKTTRTIHDHVRQASSKSKVIPEAMPDVLMLAERHFEVGEDGKSVSTKDSIGVTPGVDAEVWLTEMQKTRPHWWPGSVGSGAGGDDRGGAGGFAKNPFTRDHWNVTEQGKLLREAPERAKQMMRAAGVDKLGQKPPAKKK